MGLWGSVGIVGVYWDCGSLLGLWNYLGIVGVCWDCGSVLGLWESVGIVSIGNVGTCRDFGDQLGW
jgi:hypothetical protein